MWSNNLTKTLGIKYPIVQAPMLGITTPEMVAAICNSGALGSLPVGGLPADKTAALIRQTKALTGKPFAVNLFAHDIPETADIKVIEAMQQLLQKFTNEHNIPFQPTSFFDLHFHDYKEQIQVLLDENISIVSFTFGLLDDQIVRALKQKNVLLIGTATSVEEARLLDKSGADIITAQGIEAGGHRGSFLTTNDLPMIGSMSLIPQIVAAVNKPVLAAGGIYNGATIKAALALGAQGVQIGSAFIGCTESAATDAHKTLLENSKDTDTVLTNAYTGRWARGLSNAFTKAMQQHATEVPPYPIQMGLLASLRNRITTGNNIFMPVWAGQSAAAGFSRKDAATILRDMIIDAENVIA
jgi:nitronate monooxygenase